MECISCNLQEAQEACNLRKDIGVGNLWPAKSFDVASQGSRRRGFFRYSLSSSRNFLIITFTLQTPNSCFVIFFIGREHSLRALITKMRIVVTQRTAEPGRLGLYSCTVNTLWPDYSWTRHSRLIIK